ncbi:MAG TPA: hypothetical protein VFW92_04920 [Candidatus Limnocylindrales bacterium]|nr:hypothetical protein [Candidatus Limnocylindrales bacterium]
MPVTNEVRNHLLSTLEYVGEVSDDLALATTPDDAANALRPLGGVLDDEIDWFRAHVPSGTGGPVGAYGTDIATTRAAVAAIESAGSAPTADLVAKARAQVAALLALRPDLEALPSS